MQDSVLMIKKVCKKLESEFPEYFKIVFGEKDDSTEVEEEADEFLKMEGIRIGRDFKLYGLMETVGSLQSSIADFAEVLFTIKHKHPKAFALICLDVQGWKSIFDENIQQQWVDLWNHANQ